ncbi:MAG: hypothetical protein QHG98_04050 [Methanothrix sp.]|nr:hypothetical protein [Methanothrix sp.]
MSLKTRVLLEDWVFVKAFKSAQQKNPSITYRQYKSDPSITLIYNPATGDGMFVRKLLAKSYLDKGYYEAYPQVDWSDTFEKNQKAIQKYGWPEFKELA